MKTQELEKAFHLFSEETKRLEEAYKSLEMKFEALRLKLEESHQTLESLVAHVSDGLLFVTLKGEISLFNPAAAYLTGYPSKAVVGQLFWECFADKLFGFSMREALEEGIKDQHIFLTLSNSKKEREVELSTSFVPGRGVILLLRDRTEIRRLEQSIQRDHRLQELGEMAATLAHEIRNPLGGIEGFAALLERDLKELVKNDPAQSTALSMIQSILEGSKIVNRLVTTVLDYSRPVSLHFAQNDLVSVVKQSCLFFHEQKRCLFETQIESLPLIVDRERIQLALFNLIRNALEASKNTPVRVLIDEKGVISISDQGEGICHENLEKIFTPFFTTKVHGTGLGLSEAYKVIHAHGGTIEVESVLGKGSTFKITLPREMRDAC